MRVVETLVLTEGIPANQDAMIMSCAVGDKFFWFRVSLIRDKPGVRVVSALGESRLVGLVAAGVFRLVPRA